MKIEKEHISIDIPSFEDMKSCEISELPNVGAIYFLFKNLQLKYIGRTKNMLRRIRHHHRGESDKICYIEVSDKLERELLEKFCIRYFIPPWNYSTVINLEKDQWWYEQGDFLVHPRTGCIITKSKPGRKISNCKIIRENGEKFTEGYL